MRRSIRNRRGRLKISRNFDLQLTSMLDVLIILIVFMLKSYSTNAMFVTSSNMTLPLSTAEEIPDDSPNVIIDPIGIIVDSEKVVEFTLPEGVPAPIGQDGKPAVTPENATYEIDEALMADSGRRIKPLYDALIKQKEKAELAISKAVWKDAEGNTVPPKFMGAVIIHADKAVRYELLRKVMYTAGAAEFKTFKLVTVKNEDVQP